MNEINFADLDALKAQTETVDAVSVDMRPQMDALAEQYRARLRKCVEMNANVTQYLRDNWDWLKAHCRYTFISGIYGYHSFSHPAFSSSTFARMCVWQHKDGFLEVRWGLLNTTLARSVHGWDWREMGFEVYNGNDTSIRIDDGLGDFFLHGLDVDAQYRNLTANNLAEEGKLLARRESFYCICVPQMLISLMKLCHDCAKGKIDAYCAAKFDNDERVAHVAAVNEKWGLM